MTRVKSWLYQKIRYMKKYIVAKKRGTWNVITKIYLHYLKAVVTYERCYKEY